MNVICKCFKLIHGGPYAWYCLTSLRVISYCRLDRSIMLFKLISTTIIQQKCNILYMFSTTLPPPFSAKFVVCCIVVFHQCGFFFYWPLQTFLNFKLINATILPWEQFTAFAYLPLWYPQTCHINILLRQIFATILTQVPSQYK